MMVEKVLSGIFWVGIGLLFLQRINASEAHCNRTCGSTTVKYPFGFSNGCPYTLDSHCPNGDVYLKGYQVMEFTNESVIIDVRKGGKNSTQCYQELAILENFKQEFALTNRNVFLLAENCRKPDCNFDASNLVNFASGNCIGKIETRNFTCVSSAEQRWLPWTVLEDSMCREMLSSVIYKSTVNSSVSYYSHRVELSWWANGTCTPNPCSELAFCSQFQNPNTNQSAHRCYCPQGFVGDGFLDGSGCAEDSDCNVGRYLSSSCGKYSRLVVAICSLGLAAIVVSVIFLAYKRVASDLKNRRRAKKRMSTYARAAGLSVPVYNYKQLEKATNGFSEKERLGSGAFGTVYAGKLPSKRFVAVKKIKNMDDGGIERVINEITMLSSVDHPNLLRLLGYCLEKGEPILVYEFMPNGTLCQHLQKERGDGLSWRKRIKIAAETSCALAYLHSTLNPPIYHRDIKSSNILLDYDFNSKVADFGLSRLVICENTHISTTPQGTPGYLDPQYHQNFHLSDKSDVYSFGVVLVEIISALKVVDFSRDKTEVNLAWLAINKIGAGCVDDIVDPFLEIDKHSYTRLAVHRVAELAFRCLAFDKDVRPAMTEVAKDLESIAHWHDNGTDEYNSNSHLDITRGSSMPMLTVLSPESVLLPSFSSQSSASSNSIV